GGGGGRSYSC
ncbi:polymorphic outer membrane protein, partial [Chlamydia psittaci 02DC24]